MTDATDLDQSPAYRATMERLRTMGKVSPSGVDYWLARELQEVLAYTWEGFEPVITRAKDSCRGVGADPDNHFRQTSKMVGLGSGANRKVVDWWLTRTACDLIAMNGDPTKPEVAAAQAYFAVQTRRMELRDQADEQLAHDERRLELRGRVTESFKRVSRVASEAGVRSASQRFFHGARYQGLYDAPLDAIKKRKGLTDKDTLMDRAGPLELSANDFQMNLAAAVITRENVKGEAKAITTNRVVAQRVRKVIQDSGSPLPEDLPVEPPIKVIAQRVKQKKLPKPT